MITFLTNPIYYAKTIKIYFFKSIKYIIFYYKMSLQELPTDLINIINNNIKDIDVSIKYSKVLKEINKIQYKHVNNFSSKIEYNNKTIYYNRNKNEDKNTLFIDKYIGSECYSFFLYDYLDICHFIYYFSSY